MSSSPSTRFDGSDIDGLREDELAIPKKFLQVIMLYCYSTWTFSTAAMCAYSCLAVLSTTCMMLLNHGLYSLAAAVCREQGDGRDSRVGSLLGQPPDRCDCAASDLRAEVCGVAHEF